MADLLDLLEKTSRTFALSIPLLPEPTRRRVGVAYLLFRVADTFEDSTRWPRERRVRALEEFRRLLDGPPGPEVADRAAEWAGEVPVQRAAYRELLSELPFVQRELRRLAPEARELIGAHTARTARGMAEIVGRTDPDGHLRLRDLADLRRYCYVVAGIVGEMLTELFLLDGPGLAGVAGYLRERAVPFGEGLQLVNILKDSAADAREGRVYLPADLDRSRVFDLAHRNLAAAAEYTLALQEAGADRGVVAFNALPVELAWATLEVVEARGPGAKIARERVWEIVDGVQAALDDGRPAVSVPDRAAATGGGGTG